MDVNSASNLWEKVKTEKDVEPEHGVGVGGGKERKKTKMQTRLETNQGEEKCQ